MNLTNNFTCWIFSLWFVHVVIFMFDFLAFFQSFLPTTLNTTYFTSIFYIFRLLRMLHKELTSKKKRKGRKNVGGGSKECLRCVNTWYKKSQKNNRIHYWIPKPYFGVSMFKKSSIFYEYIDDPKSPPTSLEKCLNMPI